MGLSLIIKMSATVLCVILLLVFCLVLPFVITTGKAASKNVRMAKISTVVRLTNPLKQAIWRGKGAASMTGVDDNNVGLESNRHAVTQDGRDKEDTKDKEEAKGDEDKEDD